MRKPLTSRILGLAGIYLAVFIALIVLQFSKKGNFTLSAGGMIIRGNYLEQGDAEVYKAGFVGTVDTDDEANEKRLTGGVTIFFGGLEFNLKDSGKALTIKDNYDNITPVNPNRMRLEDGKAAGKAEFTLPDGTRIVFSSSDSAKGSELQITALFSDDANEVSIPITPRRSALTHENDQPGISYNDMWYTFLKSDNALDLGKITLTKENAISVYRPKEKQKAFDLTDFMLAAAHNVNDYNAAVTYWRNQSFTDWDNNPSRLSTEDDVVSYCAESMAHNKYIAAVSSVPAAFMNSSQNGYSSSVYIGGMSQAYRKFLAAERERTDGLTRLINSGSPAILLQDHCIDYLQTRGISNSLNDLFSVLLEINPDDLLPEHCRGVFEAYCDFNKLRTGGANPAEHLIDRSLSLLSENLRRDADKDMVYVLIQDTVDYYNCLKLGKALAEWAELTDNNDWVAVGRSLILSALNSDVPASRLYSALTPSEYAPKAVSLVNDSIWAWTASPGVTASYQDSNLNISFKFNETMSHFVIIRGIRPFQKIQIYNMDFRSDSQFERYDSSGWVYYSQENILVLKLKHRNAVETVKIFYRVETPPPPPPVENRGNDEYTNY